MRIAILKIQANSMSLSPNMRYQETSSEVSQIADATSDNANIQRLHPNLNFCSQRLK